MQQHKPIAASRKILASLQSSATRHQAVSSTPCSDNGVRWSLCEVAAGSSAVRHFRSRL